MRTTLYLLIVLTLLECAMPATRASAGHHKGRALFATDPGVDVGIANTATWMVHDPSSGAPIVATLKRGDVVILASRIPVDGWQNVIQFSTGREGWVRVERLNVSFTHHPNPGIDLEGGATGGIAQPSIDVSNKSGVDLRLHIEGLQEIDIGPRREQTVTVPPGIWSFNASASSVIPTFGHHAFLEGDAYTWAFYIVTSGSSTDSGAVGPKLKTEVRDLQSEVDRMTADANSRSILLTAEKSALDTKTSQLNTDQATLDTEKQTLDQTDQTSVDSYNQLVDRANSESTAIQAATTKYNADVDAYNAEGSAIDTLRDRLEAIATTINRSP